ncbi:response regulator transcription factor [Baekduia soli]|uniref:response regulator transcription factor n=1 Tax=Baekduia soli TaxID=496014 RepID=UPI00165268FE|nr:response regulator transcription factor [Baekduia soli]
MNPEHVRILVVDDHALVVEGLRAALAADPRHDVVATALTGRGALREARRTRPDIAVVDLRLPDTSGEELTRALLSEHPRMRVVVLTAYLDEETVRRALEAGAAAYVTKSAGLQELRSALDRVARGERAPSTAASRVVKDQHERSLVMACASVATPRQVRVLELAARGLTNEQIGRRMFISESTVRFHLQKLKARFDVTSKTELVAVAIHAGVIAPAPEAPAPGDEWLEPASGL